MRKKRKLLFIHTVVRKFLKLLICQMKKSGT